MNLMMSQMGSVASRDDLDEQTLAELAASCQISPGQIEDVYGCTPLQLSMMAESLLYPSASVLQFVFSLKASVDTDVFCAALRDVVSLNAILRTRLVDSPRGLVQVVVREDHETQRLTGVSLVQYIQNDAKLRSLGLGASLFHSAIVDERKLVLTMHHAVVDGASTALFFNDVLRIYRSQEPEKHAPYQEFARHCASIDDSAARSFWSSRFSGAPAVFPKVQQGHIPFTTLKTIHQIDTAGVRIGTDVSISLTPLYIETAWALTAARYSGSESVAYGLLLSGRTPMLDGLESTLGPTIAIVPVQVNLKRSVTTIEGALKERGACLRQLQTNPALQYGMNKIRAVSDAARLASGFQTLINIRISALFRYDDSDSADIYSYEYTEEPQGTFGLCLWFDLTTDGITVNAMSDPDVICKTELRRILHQFEHTLQALMSASLQTKLDQLSGLNPHDRADIFNWNSSVPKATQQCIHQLFTARAREQPDVLAIEAGDGAATYLELDDMSSRLAQELRQKGLSLGKPAALIFEKSLWIVVAQIAILKAGGVCVPINRSDPFIRKGDIISRSKAKIVLTSATEYANSVKLAPTVMAVTSDLLSSLPDLEDDSLVTRNGGSTPENLAFILFTSGSTGAPKGVMLDHSCIVSAYTSVSQHLGWNQGTRMLQFAAHVWDISVVEIFGTLLAGGCLCIPSEGAERSDLANYIHVKRVNWAILTPTVIRTLTPKEVPCLHSLASIGEPVGSAAAVWGSSVRFFNTWGPTEAHSIITSAELTPTTRNPETIGKPLGSAIWIVEAGNVNSLVPIGVVGEVVIEGPAVTRGYLDDPAKTKTSFILQPSWAPSRQELTRFYRSGDMAKYNADGSICFIGRQDNQVKIRGQRFELGEVERALASCWCIESVMATTQIIKGRTELLAVICLVKEASPSVQSALEEEGYLQEIPATFAGDVARRLRIVREIAESKLPSFMIPTVWKAVNKMPRTASAKLDRASISAWLKRTATATAMLRLDNVATVSLTPPTTKEEEIIVSVWSSVLGVHTQDLGRESNFVQAGGDSILAMRVSSASRKRGLVVDTVSLLTNATIADVAKASAIMEDANGVTDDSSMLISRATTVHDSSDGGKPDVAAVLDALTAGASSLGHLPKNVEKDHIEAIAPATDVQSLMLAAGGFHFEYLFGFRPALDVSRLKSAIARVIRHHAILRTVFVQLGSRLHQVILKDIPSADTSEGEESHQLTMLLPDGPGLVHFYLYVKEARCSHLRLRIHHALYDATSLGLLLRDLDAAYLDRALSNGPQFYDWAAHVDNLDVMKAQRYWGPLLSHSSMSYLVQNPSRPQSKGVAVSEKIQFRIPLQNLRNAYGRPSTTMQTVWALLLYCALGTDEDVVFGQVSGNRFMPFPSVDQVRGPCVNILPVRASLSRTTTIRTLISQLQNQAVESMPFHYLGCSSIISSCTSWPSWTTYGSILLYQNHGSFDRTITLGGAECTASAHETFGNSTDLWVVATPRCDTLEVVLASSSSAMQFEHMYWIQRSLLALLESLPDLLDCSVGEVRERNLHVAGDYPLKIRATPSINLESRNR